MKKHEREKSERDPVYLFFGTMRTRPYKEYQVIKNLSFWSVLKFSFFKEDASNGAPKVETPTESNCNQKDETFKN